MQNCNYLKLLNSDWSKILGPLFSKSFVRLNASSMIGSYTPKSKSNVKKTIKRKRVLNEGKENAVNTSILSESRSKQVLWEISNFNNGANKDSYFQTTLSKSHNCPIPNLTWTNAEELWEALVDKHSSFALYFYYFNKHPLLMPRMRSILLDWLFEVCEVYKLKRDTFYLAVVYIDQYLSVTHDVDKSQLQLIGITALHTAAKIEEIYPPSIKEFCYVTDGACSLDQVRQFELILVKTLQWHLYPLTVVYWINLFLQLSGQVATPSLDAADNFSIHPNFSKNVFIEICQLCDLCILDSNFLVFQPRIIAAAAIKHFLGNTIAKFVSGANSIELNKCFDLMLPFVSTLKDRGFICLKETAGVAPSDFHTIQIHTATLPLMDAAVESSNLFNFSKLNCHSPELCHSSTQSLLTPPDSGKKI